MAISTLEILALNNLPGYGPVAVRKIVDLATDKEVVTAEELLDLVNTYEASKKNPSFKSIDEIKRALLSAEDLLLESESQGIKVVTYIEAGFPKNLFSTINEQGREDVPLFVFYKGNLRITRKNSIAIIGSKEPTSKAKELSLYYGRQFAEAGFSVVSGLSLGCDSVALEGALQVGEGNTIAIVNHGLDIIRSDENTQLAEQILSSGGLILSKFTLGKRSTPCRFSVSNRIQAALADATLVIQAGVKGSAIHAARAALKVNKPVFCIHNEEGENDYRTNGDVMLMIDGAKYLDAKNPVQQVTEAINKNN